MKNDNDKRPARPWEAVGPTSVEFPRRRLARVVHDERGHALVEWERIDPNDRDAGPRVALSLVEDPSPTVRSLRVSSSAQGVNPYDRGVETAVDSGPRARRPADLRQLDAWIRQRRAVEANRRGDDD